MKLNGESIEKVRDTVTIKRAGNMPPLIFEIEGLPLGTEEKAESLFPSPTPPVVRVTDKKGRTVIKKGQALTRKDVDDPDYKKARRLASRRQMIYYVYLSVQNVEWKTLRVTDGGEEKSWDAFIDELWGEMKETGLTSGDYVKLQNAVLDACNIGEKEVEAAKEDFLLEE